MGTKVINAFGENGGKYIKDTTPMTPTSGLNFYAIHIITDTVFTTLTGTLSGTGLEGDTFVAGTILYGRFTAITLTSGSVIAYEG